MWFWAGRASLGLGGRSVAPRLSCGNRWVFMMVCLVSRAGSPGRLAVPCWGSALVPYFPGVGWACAGAPTSNPVPPPGSLPLQGHPVQKAAAHGVL